MPRPEFSVSGCSLCCSTIVRTTDNAEALTCSTSPPVLAVGVTVAVLSPGRRGVMKRETYRFVPAALIDRWRAFGPIASAPVCA